MKIILNVRREVLDGDWIDTDGFRFFQCRDGSFSISHNRSASDPEHPPIDDAPADDGTLPSI